MTTPGFGGLRTDQAPPLALPASFFLTAPAAMMAAGALALSTTGVLTSRWAGPTLALAHLGTLGLLGATMLGALYQLIPVVAGAPVPAPRLGHLVHALYVGGLIALVARFCGGPPVLASTGGVLLSVALTLFFGQVAVALTRAPARTWTVNGLRLAVLSLAVVLALGLRLAGGYAGSSFPVPRALWTEVHLTVGLLGWVGGLIAAVGWQVVPMFYLAPPFHPRFPPLVHGLQVTGVLGALGVLGAAMLGVDVGTGSVLLAAAPAALGVWVLAPAAVLRGLLKRRRASTDASVRFWYAALPVAFLLSPLAVLAFVSDDPRWGLAFGWLAVWGWAGTIVHGMLTRIVPFLTWFHRFSPMLGLAVVPPMRSLYPEVRVRTGLVLHVTTTFAGIFAVYTGIAWPVGAGLLATGAWLAANLVLTLSAKAPARTPGAHQTPLVNPVQR